MAILTLTTYRRKGIVAYLVPVKVVGSEVIQDGNYINGVPKSDPYNTQRFYQGKSAEVEIDLSGLLSRLYQYKEANGHKSYCGWIEVINGEIVNEWDSKESLIDDKNPNTQKLNELPELEGSTRQVDWAKSIRKKAIQSGKIQVEDAIAITSANDWIDNRDKY